MIPDATMPGATTLGSLALGPLQFDRPEWLVLAPILAALVLLIARRSLAGLGGGARLSALVVRLIVTLVLVAALAQPQWRREAKKVALTVVFDSSQSLSAQTQAEVERYVEESRREADGSRDMLGLVTAARVANVQFLPSLRSTTAERSNIGPGDGTDLASGLRRALAIAPSDAAYRVLVASDGNETTGSLSAAAEAAKAMGVPIDVLPLRYRHDAEVLVDRVVSPGQAREGEPLPVRVVLTATKPTRGRLSLLMNGTPVDLSAGEEGTSVGVELQAGTNVRTVQVPSLVKGPVKFEAVYEPGFVGNVAVGDARAENNQGLSVTFVAGRARVLAIASDPSAYEPLVRALGEGEIACDVVDPGSAPGSLIEMNGYDAILLLNQPASNFSQQQQEELRQYVHDGGGGLLMVGGGDSFGAGGWIGSPLEEALPVKLDPPQKRQMPKGALVLVIHSIEMPEGVYWGKKTAEAAVNALSRLDLVGINEYQGMTGSSAWVHEIQPVGDGTRVKRAINNLTFGDMPDFAPSIRLAYEGLMKTDAGQRHVIVISDGDPSAVPAGLLQSCLDAKITISTVEVFPHTAQSGAMMQMAKATGGRHYFINTQGQLASIPQIFIKEAQTVRRSLVQEFPAGFTPSVVAGISESLGGIRSVPALRGYVVTAEREGLALTTIRGKEGDPILAQWQHGLGRVIAYTSDATSRWNPAWLEWGSFAAFWQQQVRWVTRPTGSANVRATTEQRGDDSVITIDALDASGERLDFARWTGRLSNPDGSSTEIQLKQVGPGRYQGVVPTAQAGTFVAGLRYVAPDRTTTGGTLTGSVQLAITRPFADEFRAVQDNAALLEQVALATGGRVQDLGRPTRELWREQGVRFPVALTPIWMALALAGVGVFLVDVAVRRVRIEPRAIAAWARRLVGKGPARAEEPMGSLLAAREQARRKMTQRAGQDQPGERAARDVARTKFEASPEQIAQARRSGPGVVGPGTPPPEGAQPRPTPPASKPGEGDSLGRLMQAKKKARDEMNE